MRVWRKRRKSKDAAPKPSPGGVRGFFNWLFAVVTGLAVTAVWVALSLAMRQSTGGRTSPFSLPLVIMGGLVIMLAASVSAGYGAGKYGRQWPSKLGLILAAAFGLVAILAFDDGSQKIMAVAFAVLLIYGPINCIALPTVQPKRRK